MADTPQERTLAIIREVAEKHHVPIKELLGPSRLRQFVRARHEAIRAVHAANPRLSTPQIGAIFGRDHTTVLYALGGHRSVARDRLNTIPDRGAA